MRPAVLRRSVFLAPLAGLLIVGSAGAQATPRMVPGFDPGRAMLNDTPFFDAFKVRNLESLAAALRAKKVDAETPVLALVRGGRHLALLTMQMSYHHVAQGELAGEPWMVSF